MFSNKFVQSIPQCIRDEMALMKLNLSSSGTLQVLL